MQQPIGYISPRHFPGIYNPGGSRGQHIDRAQYRQIPSQKGHHSDELAKLIDIVSQLSDYEFCPGGRLAAQLGILGEQLRFGGLEGRHGATAEKRFRVAAGLKAFVEHAQQNLELNRVDIENRGSLPAEPPAGIVPGQSQDILNAHHGQLQRPAFHSHPVHVPAGEMDDHIHTDFKYLMTQHIGAERRVAAGIIGNGDRRNAPIRKGIPGDAHDGIHRTALGLPAGNQLQGNDELVRISQVILKNPQHIHLYPGVAAKCQIKKNQLFYY